MALNHWLLDVQQNVHNGKFFISYDGFASKAGNFDEAVATARQCLRPRSWWKGQSAIDEVRIFKIRTEDVEGWAVPQTVVYDVHKVTAEEVTKA